MALAFRRPSALGWGSWFESRGSLTAERKAGGREMSASVMDLTHNPAWPDENPDRFSRDYYGRVDIIYACIQEIYTSAAEARLHPADVSDRDNPEEITDGPLAELLREPNPTMSQYEFIEFLHMFLQIAGNDYIWKQRGPTGMPVALYHIRPDRMRVLPGDRSGPRGYVYSTDDSGPINVAADDIIHIKRPNPWNELYGLSPLHVLVRQGALNMSILGFQKATFDNGGVPGGILKLKRKVSDDDEPERLRAQWRTRFGQGAGGGFENWGRLAVMDADADFQAVQIDIDKMALPIMQGGNEIAICRGFGVPGILVQARLAIEHNGSLGGGNYEQARRSLWDETLSPEMRRAEGALTRGLRDDFPGSWQVRTDKSEVQALREDATEKATRAAMLFEKGGISRDEFRIASGYDPLGDDAGKAFRIPTSIFEVTAEELAAGAAGQMDTLFDKGIAFLGETRDAYQLPKKKGDDVRQINSRASEQSEEQMANYEVPLKPPNIAFAITGPTVDSLPEQVAALFPPDAVAAPKPPPVMMPPSGNGVGVALPPPDGKGPEQKARLRGARAERFKRRIAEVRAEQAELAEKEISRYFQQLASKVAGVLGSKAQWSAAELKVAPVKPDDLVPDAADGELARILRGIASRTAAAIWLAVNETGVAGEFDYDESHPRIEALLAKTAGRAIDINDVTREQLRQVLSVGAERGYSMKQVANGVPDEEYPGVRSVVAETYRNRAETIARTETMYAAHGSQLARYDAAGLEQVEAQDGTDDDECAERDGQIYDLDEADGIEDHPNGTLSWLPVIGDDSSANDEGE